MIKRASAGATEISVAPRERLKAFTEEKLVTSRGKLFQMLMRSGLLGANPSS